MPIPVFDTKDTIPKGFEDLYEERDGKWHPKGASGDDSGDLKKALAEEREKRQSTERMMKKAADDRADLERKLSIATHSDDDGAKAKLSKKLAELEAAYADKEKALEAPRAALEAELRTIKLDNNVKAAFLAAGGRPERADKALRDTKDRFDLAEDGRILVKDEKGEVSAASVADFFNKTYRGEMAEFYAGTKAAGGGAKGGASAATSNGRSGDRDFGALLADPQSVLKAANAAAEAA
jgi:hypothetical protein